MCSQQQVLQKKKLGKIPSFFHLEVTPGFESAEFAIICCHYYHFQLILSYFQNYLYRLKLPRFFSIQAGKGKNKGKRLLPYSGNHETNRATPSSTLIALVSELLLC